MVECTDCHGSGCKEGTKSKTCPHCNGSGVVVASQGFFRVQQECPKCRGTGKIIESPCKKCHGEGRVRSSNTIDLTIPKGVDTGAKFRLPGKGEAGRNGAPAGDLYVVVQVQEHSIFQRDGEDLHIEVPISFTCAALGGKVSVPTLDGRLNLTIKEGTQSGAILRVPNKGCPILNSARVGYLYCHIIVETPINLTEKQKEILKNFEESLSGDSKSSKTHEPKKKSFFDGVKDFFDDLKN